jgi:formylglycine-generating enzyme required for sulfatase activity
MKKCMLGMLFVIIAMVANANNVQLTNIAVTNNVANTAKIIQFDLSWENSWRTTSTNNWDGVWVFFKFKDNDGKWYPLRFTGTNITMPVGATYNMGNSGPTAQGVGMFIYRSQNGFGTAVANDIKAGIESYPGIFEVRGFAIEMVYIPQGSFHVGDSSEFTTSTFTDGGSNRPFLITGTGANTQMGNLSGTLNDRQSSSYSGSLTGFNSGFSDFWVMKYELSQGAYRDFLNTLTYFQQLNRFPAASPPTAASGTDITGVTLIRQSMEIITSGNSTGNTTPAVVGCDLDNDNIYDESTDGEWISKTGLTYPDCAAYLDWAGLRPLTELEFEKACRGPLYPIPEEFAWGTADIASSIYLLSNSGRPTETITNGSSVSGNAIWSNSGLNTVRGGVFANAFSTRISSGASYYGLLDLSGNLSELTVTTSNVAGRSYNGKHGDGLLNASGAANEDYWPGINGNANPLIANGIVTTGGVTAGAGIRIRGGSYSDNIAILNVSERGIAGPDGTANNSTTKINNLGIRGGRSNF